VPEAAILWRLLVVAAALVLVVAGFVGLLGLGRAEWRRERPSRRRYLSVVARFGLAFLLVLIVTS